MARDGQVTSLRKLSGNALPCQGFSINNNIFDVQIQISFTFYFFIFYYRCYLRPAVMESTLEQHLDDTYVESGWFERHILNLCCSKGTYFYSCHFILSLYLFCSMKNQAVVGILCTDEQGHNLGCK